MLPWEQGCWGDGPAALRSWAKSPRATAQAAQIFCSFCNGKSHHLLTAWNKERTGEFSPGLQFLVTLCTGESGCL